MQHDFSKFDPADWLALWKEAGGGWAGRSLLLPSQHRRTLQRMVDDLALDELRAIAEHMGVNVEPAE
jgi:hypothetical protein